MRMKSIAKSLTSLCVAVAVLSSCFLLGGCSDEDEKLTDSNSTVWRTESFTFSVYNEYKISEEDSSDDKKCFENSLSKTVIYVMDDSANNATLAANAEFQKRIIADAYDMPDSEIDVEKCSTDYYDECYCITYNVDDAEEGDVTYCMYLIYDDGLILKMAAGTKPSGIGKLKEKMKNMLNTVKYTGEYDYTQPEDMYPFTIENNYFRVTVREGFDSRNACKAREDSGESKKEYHVESDNIKVNYRASDDYDKGLISQLKIQYLTDDTAIQDQAQEKFEKISKKENMYIDSNIRKISLGDVFTCGNDSLSRKGYSLSDIEAYCVSTRGKDTCLAMELYHFEIEGKKYCVGCFYKYGDDASREELLGLFGDIEFY